MPRPRVYPISLLLEGQACLVIGGGEVARSKVEGLLEAGATVTVIATTIHENIAALPVETYERPYQKGDCAGFALVIAATGDRQLDAAIHAECRDLGTLVNAADNPAASSFFLPALLREGDLSVAISSAGASPAIASWVRDRIGGLLGNRFRDVVEIVATTRAQIRAGGLSSEGLPWPALIDELAALLARGADRLEADALAARWKDQIIAPTDSDRDADGRDRRS